MRVLPAALACFLAACHGSPQTDRGVRDPDPSPGDLPPGGLTADALRSLVVAPVVSACGTPVVDGILSPGEWDAAVSFRFGSPRPESAGGGEVPGTFQAMSDGVNLYIAFRLEQDTTAFAQSHYVELDANHDGAISQGDDVFGFSRWPDPWSSEEQVTLFTDAYRWNCVVDGSPAVCGPADVEVLEGFPPPGTNDGGATIRIDDTSTVVELWHPYRGADLRDVAASPGDVVPLSLAVRLLDTCADYPRCYGDTGFPATGFRDVVIGCGPPTGETVVTVRIDVKPGDALPTIHLSCGGTVAVALLGSAAFDAGDVDPSTTYFAAAPVALKENGDPRMSVEDTNSDGFRDAVLHFETARLALEPGDVEATLAGRTFGGVAFKGSDVVRVLP